MGLFENFPYANFHELNLDWILHELKQLETQISNFVAINSVKYANPIVWDITSQYETNTVVLDSSGNAYLSVQPVPAGVSLDRDDYWTNIGNFSALWDSVRSAITPYDEQHSTTASVDHKAGDWVWLENNLLLITKNIVAGDKYVEGSNCNKTNVHDLFTALSGELQNEIIQRENADEDLKIELLKAISDEKKNFIDMKTAGAVGDGVTDDTEVFNSVFTGGNKTIFIPEGNYKISDTINIDSNTKIICSGTILHTFTAATAGNYKSTFSANGKTNISLMGIKMNGTGAVNGDLISSCCMLFTNCTNVKITNCSFYDIQSAYCVLLRKCDTVTIKGCTIKEYSFSGINNMFSENVYVIENNVINCVNTAYPNTYPISLNGYDTEIPAGTPMPKNLNAISNYVKNNIPWWEGISWHGGDGVTVVNNRVVGTNTGIASLNSPDKNFTSRNVIISNNYVELGTDTSAAREANNTCLTLSGENLVACNNILLNGGVVLGSLAGNRQVASVYLVELKNAIVANNTISNGYGNIFDIRGSDNITIKNNLIANNTADVTRALCFIYNFKNAANNKTIIINDNIVKNCKDFVDVNTNNANTAEGYIKITGDTYDTDVAITPQKNVIKQLSTVASLTMGHVGDIVMRYPPAVGQPIGWVCTTNWVNGEGGTWTPMPNI